MKYTILALIFVLSACKNGGDNSAATADPIYGEWYYEKVGSTQYSATGFIVNIQSNGNIEFQDGYLESDGNSMKAVMRKSIGTFTREGDVFHIKYSYDTCDRIKQEDLYISAMNGKLLIQNYDKSVKFSLSPISGNSTIKTASYLEDKNCNILSKIEAASKRVPASVKSKSFLDRVVK
ncbi:MAG TPA: hypothetical protein VIG33_14885 [Pseudobdellovibrionaceae bacterium]|jgi:hypothetical protein